MFRLPFAILPLLGTLAPSALADVEFTAPAAGGTLDATGFTVSWTDGGSSPKLSTLNTYTLEIVLGGNTVGPDTMVLPLVTSGDFADGNSAKGKISNPAAAGLVKNGWYLRMTSVSSDGGSVINYSDRFTLSGMTGVTPEAFEEAVPGGTSGPADPPSNMIPAAADPAAVVPAEGDYDVPFNKQSGSIRYAPMQPFPPTKITKKGKPTPLFPTSAFDIATEKMGLPSVITTVTQSQTVHAMTMENTVAPAAHANGNNDMAKFLNRWKD